MSVVSKVIESIVDEGFRIIKLLKFGEDDNVNAFQIATFGEDFNVPEGYNALFIKTSNSSEPVCVGYINKLVIDSLNSGEKQIFSTNASGSSVASYMKLLNDGIINFNGDADFITGFTGMESAMAGLTSFLNTELAKIAIGIAAGGGSYSPGTANIDISASKKDNLKTE